MINNSGEDKDTVFHEDSINLSDNEKDLELVRSAKSGNVMALNILILKYKNLVNKIASKYYFAGGDKDDVSQEGMLGLYKSIRDFDEEKSRCTFKKFAEVCIDRQIITAMRSANRKKHVFLNTYVSLDKPAYSEDSDYSVIEFLKTDYITNPEDIILIKEGKEEIDKKIAKSFTTLEQNVLKAYAETSSYKDVADRLGVDVKTVDNALQRIRKKVFKSWKID